MHLTERLITPRSLPGSCFFFLIFCSKPGNAPGRRCLSELKATGMPALLISLELVRHLLQLLEVLSMAAKKLRNLGSGAKRQQSRRSSDDFCDRGAARSTISFSVLLPQASLRLSLGAGACGACKAEMPRLRDIPSKKCKAFSRSCRTSCS